MLFQNPRPQAFYNLDSAIKKDGVVSFYIPDIVSMEIHSVLGKYRRGGASIQHAACDRQVVGTMNPIACTHTCIFPARKRITEKVFGRMQKLIKDIEAGRGDVKAFILPVGNPEFITARNLLIQYADRYSFGSHDALVAATALTSRTNNKAVTLVTSDKGLKAVCAAESIAVFDPAKGSEV